MLLVSPQKQFKKTRSIPLPLALPLTLHAPKEVHVRNINWKKALIKNPPCWHLDLGLPDSRAVGNKGLLVKPYLLDTIPFHGP